MSNSKDDIWNLRCEIWNSERQGGIAPPGSHSKTRNAAAPYELALRAERRYQPGDQISYYVTGAKAKVKISDNCKLASEWDAEHPDENVEHYRAKLTELYEKFRPFIKGGETDDGELRLSAGD
ncbi:MAG TPA: hypothetical protein VMR20_10090 [Verrucomicrobiae bacterium]|nr:hypothetical protein [Verrucomicrobiae bacterium]